MPKKYDRCVKKVKKSLKKYKRKGNAYAICSKLKKAKKSGYTKAKSGLSKLRKVRP